MNLNNFFAELKRRNVYKIAAAYAVVSWLLVQIASIVFPTFEAPAAAMKILIVLLLIGFPIALAFSWAFEIMPERVLRESEIESGKPVAHPTGRKIVAITIFLAVIAAGLLIFQLFPKAQTAAPRPSGAVIASVPEKSIAVLPFQNLSDNKANAYFAEGIQNEILTKLAAVADLKVISRTSTAKYASKPDDLKEVSQQLGVAHVLEGAVQRAGDKVRVNVQLIDARVDSHLWAKSYDGEAKDVFGMESEVAQQVADALRAKLSPDEAHSVTAAPTNDPEAYDLFLRGEYEFYEAQSTQLAPPMDRATEWYRQAIVRDPKFSLAMARLVEVRMLRQWYVEPLPESEIEQLGITVQEALTLNPKLAEIHIALGIFYYFGSRQYDKALTAFGRAIELQPNNARALEFSGYVHRRQGQWQQSLTELLKSQEQSPRDPFLPANLGLSYGQLRMWKEAERCGARALALDPHNADGLRVSLLSCLNERDDRDEARRLLDTFPPNSILLNDAIHADCDGLVGQRAYFYLLERDFGSALGLFDAPNESESISEAARLSSRTAIHLVANDRVTPPDDVAKARELVEAKLRDRPGDLDAIIELSWINLGLGRKDQAVAMANQAVALLPLEKDVLAGSYPLYNLALIEAHAGQATEAIDILRRLLAIPAGLKVSIAQLKSYPGWDPIRNDPQFQQLLTSKEHVGP